MRETSMTDATAKILILTPVKSAARYLASYFGRLNTLTYPRELLSLGVLEGDSDDRTYASVESSLPSLGFRRTGLWKKDFHLALPPGVPRFEAVYQFTRRAVLARARNHLLFRALDDEDWVLWLDVDVVDYPANILEQLVAIDRDIVHPHCVTEPGGPTFDLNAWRDQGAVHMDKLRGQDIVRLDAVGGTMLLIRADRHRDGLVFPPFFYGRRSPWIRPTHPLSGGDLGEIETEGLGIMAKDMGLECWGLPDLEILHAK
jgi:glycosyltransferase involved in cell wall biosynthesis